MPAQTQRVLQEVADERTRQHKKWGEENHPSFIALPKGEEIPLDQKKAMLLKYYGLPRAATARDECNLAEAEGRCTWGHIAIEEVVEAVEECDDPVKLRVELVQTAAVLVAWVECLDRDHVRREKFNTFAGHLQVGDLFEYVGSFAQYKVESELEPDLPNYSGDDTVTFRHSRRGKMIGSGIRLAWNRPVTVWRCMNEHPTAPSKND